MRLLLHIAAYWLLLTLRDAIPKPQPLASAEFKTVRLRLIKIAARIIETTTRVRIVDGGRQATFEHGTIMCSNGNCDVSVS